METVAPWWFWPIALFAVSFAIGIVAVLAGVANVPALNLLMAAASGFFAGGG